MRQWIPTTLAVAALLVAIPLGFAGNHNGGEPAPAANKTAAAGASLQYMPPDFMDDDEGVTVLSTAMKVGGPVDLLLQVSLECALWTETVVTTIGGHPNGISDTSEARADVVVWIEINGQPVLVHDEGTDGKVTFCDRVQRQSIEDMDESTGNWTMRTYLETKNANAFNWIVIDANQYVQDSSDKTIQVEVKADIDAQNSEGAFASGAIGKRTLIVEPTRFPNGASI